MATQLCPKKMKNQNQKSHGHRIEAVLKPYRWRILIQWTRKLLIRLIQLFPFRIMVDEHTAVLVIGIGYVHVGVLTQQRANKLG